VALYIDQTLRFWLEAGIAANQEGRLVLKDKQKMDEGSKSSGIASVVVSRFDRLSPEIQIVLKLASVLGRLVATLNKRANSEIVSNQGN
jgi:predicted ATPase